MITDKMPESACSTLDVADAERSALTVRESLESLIVNVDMTSLQYNAEKMMNVATELGFEDEDLENLGLELHENSCNMGVCNLNFADVKGLDKIINAAEKLKGFEEKLKCHPLAKDVPNV
jgi:hypothetical protein